jgi:hypothetical protein
MDFDIYVCGGCLFKLKHQEKSETERVTRSRVGDGKTKNCGLWILPVPCGALTRSVVYFDSAH